MKTTSPVEIQDIVEIPRPLAEANLLSDRVKSSSTVVELLLSGAGWTGMEWPGIECVAQDESRLVCIWLRV